MAMMHALCARCGVQLPPPPPLTEANGVVQVFVICNRQTAGEMATELERALAESGRVRLVCSDEPDPPQLAAADRVLLLLSKGVLTPTSLNQLDAVIA